MKVQVAILMNAAPPVASGSNDPGVQERNTNKVRVGATRRLSGWRPVIAAAVASAKVTVAEIVAAKCHRLPIVRGILAERRRRREQRM
ncbi:hypothetical protein [Burkholderia stabilis]|uniref:hypothetical protein n=1 Tax=Burkholderia stabilis TaxID=95485 RepID=UPI0012E9C6CF|nr:hypothetical protein [Burkholderia stabilis]HDR9492289.1 hypothetical protein [Burkholderia stabilis]HDR9496437.1 hypothetical protein [Burkholderia stabilis]HDR9522831.1 hypothetical protein [Burkholderia stabilis]HDR9539901.1 hypothetical protein [Burkholderia stabilis]HDR9542996.1 hypothetical protein [Burkholderia stabilis]